MSLPFARSAFVVRNRDVYADLGMRDRGYRSDARDVSFAFAVSAVDVVNAVADFKSRFVVFRVIFRLRHHHSDEPRSEKRRRAVVLATPIGFDVASVDAKCGHYAVAHTVGEIIVGRLVAFIFGARFERNTHGILERGSHCFAAP